MTEAFYTKLGFERGWKDAGWMILKRGSLTLEFFPHADLVPSESWFSCCLRLDDVEAFYQTCLSAGIPESCWGQPRIQQPKLEDDLLIGALIDPDGTLIRLIQN